MRTTGCIVNATPVTAPLGCVCTDKDAAVCVTVKDDDVADVSPLDVNVSECPPVPAILRFVNVTTPLTAATVVVPVSVPVPLAIATVTLAVLVVRLPPASRNCTTGCVVNATPLTAPAGCVVIATCVGVPAVTVTLDDVVVSVGDVVANCNVCAPVPVICRLVNVATPFTAVAVTVPPSVPVPLAMEAVTTRLAPVPVVTTTLP